MFILRAQHWGVGELARHETPNRAIPQRARRGNSGSRTVRKLAFAALAVLLAATGSASLHLGLAPTPAAAAEELAAPEVYKMQGFYVRIDDVVDELRADFVLKVPHGFVNETTGALQPVDGVYLRVGYDYNTTTALRSMRYLNTMGGKAGAENWARNQDEYFTVHKVIRSGKSDFLVISVEGDLNIPDNAAENNTPGGSETPMNWYFSYLAGTPTTSTTWIRDARTIETVTYWAYMGRTASSLAERTITGPQFKMQWDGIYSLWSGRQANWGQVLDFGLNTSPEGIFPPNSIPLDLVNNATRNSNPEAGNAGTVSDSYWYAWVHEDGSLVTSINTAPIHVTGVTPRSRGNSATSLVSKNIAQGGSAEPMLGWTPEQAAQGLTERVGLDGSIDFTDAGGTGYYRLLAWPEARDPLTPSGDYGAPKISYTAADLFDTNGMLTPAADAAKWIPGTAYYKYDIPTPEPPVITVPPENSHTNAPGSIVISGTGVPGHTISLKLTAGTGITDFNDPALTTLVDGDHEGVGPDDIVVDADGNWSYTYTPEPPLVDGEYTVVAVQTDQTPDNFHLTSGMSNPKDPEAPALWGVTFTVDTVAPDAPAMVCPASPTAETAPTFTGSGIETGAKVFVSQGGERIGEATVTGADWSYTVDPPLANGTYTFTVTQVDQAGNESVVSSPVCELRVATAVPATGGKAVVPVQHGDPELPDVAAENWEITVSDGTDTEVMSGDTPAQLKRDTEYTVDERLRETPAPEVAAGRYTQLGDLACVDAEGAQLPEGVLNAEAGTLTVGSDVDVAEPIACTVTNQAAHASFVTQRLGGQTTLPDANWKLGLESAEAGFDTDLDATTPSAIVRPGDLTLTASAPTGLSVVGIQQLDLSRAECAAQAAAAATAPQDCWVEVSGAPAHTATAAQGTHAVFRVVAAAPADLPALPITGGLGSWVFTVGGAGVFALAAGAYVRRRYLMAAAVTEDRGSE